MSDPVTVSGDDARELLNDVMTTVLKKIIDDPKGRDSYLAAFKIILDTEFGGLHDDLKKTLVAYLELKECIAKTPEDVDR